jgi:hypothetical protein
MARTEFDENWADDHGYSRGRCACGRRTWSDTGVMDCGCGATIAELEELEAMDAEDDEPDAECTCIATDADIVNAAYCDLHGGIR